MSMKKAIILINLGSPDSPEISDVRKYLAEFLWDKRVIDINPIARWLLLHGIILRKRPQSSSAAYRKVWTKNGSPLIVLSKQLRDRLAEQTDLPVYLGMRYGNPSIESVIKQLTADGITHALAIPLYPHYAMSSYETVVEKVREDSVRLNSGITFDFLPPFYDDPVYISALVTSATPFLGKQFDHLLFSFHGIPVSHLHKSDPSGKHCVQSQNCCDISSPSHKTCYRHQCYATVKAFVSLANIPDEKYSVSFQSRLGKKEWLTPYTVDELARLAKAGKRKLLVICPAFVSDCLETLEEIAVEGKSIFLDAGGESFQQIPCLNTHPQWIRFLRQKCELYAGNPPA